MNKQLLTWLRNIKHKGNSYNKKQMAKQLSAWLGDINHAIEDLDDGFKVRIYTEKYYYAIVAKLKSSFAGLCRGTTYLGCVASCRAPRPGETWTRGSDLPDGEFNRATWDKIVHSIIRYESLPLERDI